MQDHREAEEFFRAEDSSTFHGPRSEEPPEEVPIAKEGEVVGPPLEEEVVASGPPGAAAVAEPEPPATTLFEEPQRGEAADGRGSQETAVAELEDSKVLPQGRVLALVNQKGGVGKTTSTINLGAALAEEGARVLLVDFDPQGALSVGLGFNPNELEVSIYNLLLDRTTTLQEVAHPTKIEGVDLIPSNIDLSAAEVMLVAEVAREQMLRRVLAPAREIYNFLLIDCPPSLGLLTVNALTAADGVVVPLECEYFALRGMALLMNTIEKVKERLNPQLRIEGILATMLDRRTVHGREVLNRVTEAFGDQLFKTVIHRTVRFAEAPVVGEPILTYAPKSNGAQEYRDLAREVISR